MSYDASKDELLFQRSVEIAGKSTGIEVSVCRYDGGDQKVQLRRFGIKKSGERYYIPKLQRLSLLEMQGIIDAWTDFRGR
jgi:hypothetical protein